MPKKYHIPPDLVVDQRALITASATLCPFSLACSAVWWTEGSRRYLDGLQYRGKH